MMNWAITFLVIALIAAVLGFTGIAGVAIEIAWIVFVVGMIMSIFFFIRSSKSPLLNPVTKISLDYCCQIILINP